jgi:hypothetical protein
MKSKSKNGQRHNALKHGAFAKELNILFENPKDFDELQRNCVNELKPSGSMEEEVVLTIAKYLWRKRRIERFFADEANWLQQHPDEEDLKQVSRVDQCIQKGMPCRHAWEFLIFLPELVRNEIQKEFTCPSTEFDDEWIGRLKRSIDKLRQLSMRALFVKIKDKRFMGEKRWGQWPGQLRLVAAAAARDRARGTRASHSRNRSPRPD